ncbi:MAG: DMT family transporter [Acidimicrobiales bacterium]
MGIEIPLALAASVFTASASVLLRAAAAPAPGELRLRLGLVAYLLRRPQWFLGICCMIGGFGFQVAALHAGELALVQPVIASEMLFVFAYLAVRARDHVHVRDWAAAGGMAASLGVFLYLADPSGGSAAAVSPASWAWAAAAGFVCASAAAVLSLVRTRRGGAPTPGRRAAMLGVSAGVTWGFVAAVVKELSTHLGQGAGAVFGNWSPYVLVVVGALGMYLASNAFQAGPLAASQPALTMMEPLVASLLGITIFGEHVRHGPWDLVGEAVLLMVLVVSVVHLCRSPLVALDVAAGHRRAERATGTRGRRSLPRRNRRRRRDHRPECREARRGRRTRTPPTGRERHRA